uniref:Amidohydro-rel domain-containing protein n=1 Tax=Globodera pallida TaxID=36090 RepID=A0A183CEK0_GLOPA
RHRWREQCRRFNELEQRLSLTTSEAQMLRTELQASRRDEHRQLEDRHPTLPRDFTEISYTMHEWQTLKAKLERSELSVAERTREMSESELRAKGAEEQTAELERRAEHLARTGAANEVQMKLFQEDLEVLRGKLETKNQQLETRDRERKRLETELEMSRTEVREQQHRAQDSERRGAQLTHQIDQLERELRERDLQLERLRKHMQEPAAARAEAELHQRLDNALEDRKKLEQLMDQLRAQNDAERYQQLEQFRIDREQLEMNIHCLKKELADRHVLISSQNEKIAQLDNAIAKQQQLVENGGDTAQKQTAARECNSSGEGDGDQQQQNELDRTRRDMDRLLERVRELEREKRQRQHQTADGMEEMDGNGKMPAGSSTMSGVSGGTEERTTDALKHRIHELEEALQESVGITSEREKALAEQKKLCQKLSDQVTELFEAGSGAAVSQHQRQLRDALNALAETRTVRKELGMALVAEKEAAIALVHSCYGHDGIAPQPVRERLEQMHRQKERLRHALLTSTSGCGADGEKQQEELTRALGTAPPSAAVAAAAPAGHAGRQQQFSQPISIQTSGNICGSPHAQQQHPPPLGMSAPASLTYYGGGVNNSIPHQQLEDFGGGGIASLVDEEGIWARNQKPTKMATDFRGRILTAPWIWLGGQFQHDVRLHIDGNGKIVQITKGHNEEMGDGCNDGTMNCHLNSLALLPGFVNAHSHAFHRRLRGRSRIGGLGADTFWKWREEMYALVRHIDFAQMKEDILILMLEKLEKFLADQTAAKLYVPRFITKSFLFFYICVDTFREMLAAGITTVGEFHYVHHENNDQQQQDDGGLFALDLAVVEAALEKLCTCDQASALPGLKPINGDSTQNLDTVTLALAVHSLRAASVPAAHQMVQFALSHRLPLHIHLEEQPCAKADEQRREPSQLLLQDIMPPSPHSLHFLTVVHCTYTRRHSLDAHICVCPCTEGFLGDGVPKLDENDRICVGTDCNNRIAILEELRWLVFCQNMLKNCRNCAALDATKMIDIGTKNGASSLGLADSVGEFSVGRWMDFVAIDCRSDRLAHFVGGGDQLADAIMFSAGNAEIALTAVAGKVLFDKRANEC